MIMFFSVSYDKIIPVGVMEHGRFVYKSGNCAVHSLFISLAGLRGFRQNSSWVFSSCGKGRWISGITAGRYDEQLGWSCGYLGGLEEKSKYDIILEQSRLIVWRSVSVGTSFWNECQHRTFKLFFYPYVEVDGKFLQIKTCSF